MILKEKLKILDHFGVNLRSLVIVIWILVCLVATLQTLLTGRTVTLNVYNASHNFFSLGILYSGTGAGFIYLMQSAILYTPFALLPFALSEILWRCINWVIIFLGVIWWLKDLRVTDINSVAKDWLLFSVLFIPTAFSSLRNGQMNMIIVSGALWFFYSLYNNRPNLAGFILTTVFFFKPTGIVLCLLAFCLYSKIRLPMIVSTVVFLLLPFMVNFHWDYVYNQYIAVLHSLFISAQVGSKTVNSWAQIFNPLFILLHHKISVFSQHIIRIIFAVITLLLAFAAKRNYGKVGGYLLVYSLAASYLMLFNPRTENNDYIILGIGIAMSGVVFMYLKEYWGLLIMVLFAIGLLVSHSITGLITPLNRSWFAPVIASLCYLYLALVVIFKLYPRCNGSNVAVS